MAISKRRLRINHFSKRHADVVDCVFTCCYTALLGFERNDFVDQIFLVQSAPESSGVRQGNGGLDQIRIEPAAAAPAHGFDCSGRPSRGEENIKRLRNVRNSGKDWYPLSAESVRITASIPVLVQTVNAGGDGGCKTQ